MAFWHSVAFSGKFTRLITVEDNGSFEFEFNGPRSSGGNVYIQTR
jgi:hypothetical protein